MSELVAVSPMAWSDLLDFAGSRPLIRKAFVAMASRGQCAGFRDDLGFYAVAFLVPVGASLEFCLSAEPRACTRMRGLIRLAHLTFCRLAETGLAIHAYVAPGNRSGERMARLAGFVVDAADPTLWRFAGTDGQRSQNLVRRRRRGRGEESRGGKQAGAAGGE